MYKQMGYFGGLQKIAKQLIKIAEDEKDSQKSFKSKLQQVFNQLKTDFTKDEIKDSMEDEFFFESFVDQFKELVTSLIAECNRVIKGCNDRRAILRKTIIRSD